LNAKQAKNLLNVARALRESANPKLFTMERYVWGDTNKWLMREQIEDKNNLEFCGTPACALGHYAARRDLQKLLHIEVVKRVDVDRAPHARVVSNTYGSEVCFEDDELTEHFGIDTEDAEDLFGPSGCGGARTPKAAAKYIERFVAEKVEDRKKQAADVAALSSALKAHQARVRR
jgi:hypothetical protein